MNPLKLFLPHGRAPRRVLTGLLRGIALELDPRAGETQLWAGFYERETFAAVRRLVHGCQGALDLGAARGELVVFFLRQPGMQRVMAVEPSPDGLATLQRTLALNGLAGDARVLVHPGFAGRGAPPLWRTLDDLAREVPGPLFIKIDIDGPEAEVLAGGQEALRSKDCRLLIETHSTEAEAGCTRQLRDQGYHVQIIPNAWWRAFLPEHRTIAHNRWLAAWRNPA